MRIFCPAMAASSFSRTALEPMPCVSVVACRPNSPGPADPRGRACRTRRPGLGSCDDSHAFLVGGTRRPGDDTGHRVEVSVTGADLGTDPGSTHPGGLRRATWTVCQRPAALANPPGGVGRSPTGPTAAGVLLVDLRDPAGAHGTAA